MKLRAARPLLAASAVLLALLGLPPVAAAGPPHRESDGIQPFVVNGSLADGARWRFFAAVLDPGISDPYYAQFCGGAVVAPSVVLTAAHCVTGRSSVDVLVDTDRLDPGRGSRIRSARIWVHPGWLPSDTRNDLAVIRLSRATEVPPVAVATPSNRDYWSPGSSARIAGFGCDLWSNYAYDCYSYPTALMEGRVPVRPDDACEDDPGVVFDPVSMLCAGTSSASGAAADACFGDSGGPLVVSGPGGDPLLAGLVSHGPGCGAHPGVYTRLGSYSSWLAQQGVGVGTTSAPGYRLAAADGGIFSFGQAGYLGSTGALTLARPIVDIAPTPTGRGYWLAAADGGIFTFGDAVYHGSTGNLTLARPIVGIAPTPTGRGYWLAAADGGIFTFGDAHYYGSTGTLTPTQPVVGMTAT